MSRILLCVSFFLFAAFATSLGGAAQQPEKKQPAKGKFAPSDSLKPDRAALKLIEEKTEQLRSAVAALREQKVADGILIEVEIFLKAAENIVRFNEWFAKDSVKWTLLSLDRGLERAKEAAGGKAPWRDSPGHWIPRAYRSEIDGSIQPYAVMLPREWKQDPSKKWRMDVVLHGRDGSLTEAKFLATHDAARTAPKDLDFVQLEVYGRGNNAYRWAGESDVFEAIAGFDKDLGQRMVSSIDTLTPWGGYKPTEPSRIDPKRVVIRGFSMGGAGTWHIGLHRPFTFAVMGPGAGFTTTHGYVGDLPSKLPDHQEKCLRIYDAVNYAENAFNIPVVAFSGELDPQKKAADNIESLVKEFKEPTKFAHLIAPGLKHEQPKPWLEKCEAEYRKHLVDRTPPERVRFVTYTPRYGDFEHGSVEALEEQYEKAVVDSTRSERRLTIKTSNVAALKLPGFPGEAEVDGQKFEAPPRSYYHLVKTENTWRIVDEKEWLAEPRKRHGLQGPIDDAFMSGFVVVPPRGPGWHDDTDKHIGRTSKQFAADWDKSFRGTLPIREPSQIKKDSGDHLVLFGDPQSNSLIAAALPKLPIKWTKETLTVNGVDYDAKTHVPVMIYPNPFQTGRYVVLNSGHTFSEADLKGTNALLYPRLGDWAVIKLAPTEKNPNATEVVAAGLFDERWRFVK